MDVFPASDVYGRVFSTGVLISLVEVLKQWWVIFFVHYGSAIFLP